MGMDDMAALVEATLASEDLSGFAELLDSDVTWGAPGARDPSCKNRNQVLEWYRRRRDTGVRGSVLEVEVLADRLVVSMSVRGTDSAAARGGAALRFQLLTVRSGRIVDIVGFDDKAEALSHAGWQEAGPGGGMTEAQLAAATRAARVYDAASDHYDDPALAFWDRFGRSTVERLGLTRGARVLDLCCGAGASAVAAAQVVGASGRVVGIDVSDRLLAMAASKAARLGLDNVELVCGDATDLALLERDFDAVVCVFGVFFAADRESFVAEMLRHVRPGGVLAVTTWAAEVFEPANTVFWDQVARLRPDLHKAFNPWDDLTSPEAVVDLLRAGGVPAPEAALERSAHPLVDVEDFWRIVLGSGYRGTVAALAPGDAEVLRQAVVSELGRQGVTEIKADVIYGTGRR